MKNFHHLFITFLLMTLPGAAMASTEPNLHPKNDQQKDAKSIAKGIEKIERKAQDLDVNKNGYYDPEEIDAKKEKLGVMAEFALQALDLDGNGIITTQEYVQAQSDELYKADLNHDGWIDKDEERAQKRKILRRALGF